jgi:hypothetical protein
VKDVSTNTRKIISGTNPLHKSFAKTVQVQSQLNIEDSSITSYELNFMAPDLQETDAENASPNTCLLEDENGPVVSGELNSSREASSTNQQSYACKFSRDNFYKIVALKITDIRIIMADGKAGSFSIDKNLRDTIAKQAKAILARFNNQQ